MSDTHINAYFADVEEKKQKVAEAKAEYAAAQERLAAKKREINWEEDETSDEVNDEAQSEESSDQKQHGHRKK